MYLFNVEAAPPLQLAAKRRRVPLKAHRVVYHLVADLRDELSARMPPVQEEELLGEANVLQPFEVSDGKRKVPVAGARCVRGVLARDALYRLVRDGEVVYEGDPFRTGCFVGPARI